MAGPLAGTRVVELGGIGPVSFAGMMLSDLGADVVRFERPGDVLRPDDVTTRGRRLVQADLTTEAGRLLALTLLDRAEVALDGFRPGTLERMGLGPDVVLPRNTRLVFARATGWGTTGPLASEPSHDINGLALSGILNLCRLPGAMPFAPPMVIGDYGGGGMMVVAGVACALLEARASGRGQLVECSIVSGCASLAASFWGLRASGEWSPELGTNISDGGAPFYNVYECADGKFVAVGAIEPRLYRALVTTLGLTDAWDDQMDTTSWAARREELEAIFRTRTRDLWEAFFEGSGAAVTPVLDLDEAPQHPHNVAHGTFTHERDIVEPAVSPRFSRTPGAVRRTSIETDPARLWEHPGDAPPSQEQAAP